VVRDTKFTFEIVTRGDKVRVRRLGVRWVLFSVRWAARPGGWGGGGGGGGGEDLEAGVDWELRQQRERKKPLVFEIYGNRFQTRAADRANKKVRLHLDPQL